jgi:hypothetical protein
MDRKLWPQVRDARQATQTNRNVKKLTEPRRKAKQRNEKEKRNEQTASFKAHIP